MHRGYLFRVNMVGTIIEVNAEDNTYLVEFDVPRDWDRKLGRRYRILSLNNKDKERVSTRRGGRNETNQNIILYRYENECDENIRRFQEQVFSPDANAEDAQGFQ